MKPAVRKARELSRWKRVKRNGNIYRKHKGIINSINKLASDRSHIPVNSSQIREESVTAILDRNDILNDSSTESTDQSFEENGGGNIETLANSVRHSNNAPQLIDENSVHNHIDESENSDQFSGSNVASDGPIFNDVISYSESDIDCVVEKQTKFRETLMNWAVEFQIKHNATNQLLKLLRDEFPFTDLPADARTLVKTPRSITISVLHGDDGKNGQYWHYGLKKVLSEALEHPYNTLHLNINIDGLPMFRSSSNSFWPILVCVEELKKDLPPLIIGIYCGKSKKCFFFN